MCLIGFNKFNAKMLTILNFLPKKFGNIKKKQYLCIRKGL